VKCEDVWNLLADVWVPKIETESMLGTEVTDFTVEESPHDWAISTIESFGSSPALHT